MLRPLLGGVGSSAMHVHLVYFRTALIGATSGSIGNFFSEIGGLAVLWVGAYLVLEGQLTVGQLIAFRIISGNVVGPIIRLASTWQTIQSLQISVERLADVVDAPTEQPEDSQPIALPPIKGKVEFDNVSFRFNPNSALVVKSVSFCVHPGKFIGIVGQSGSGKSTIMKLLPRLYNVEEGMMRIDDYDIQKVDLDSLRQQIGIVPQDSMLFDGSIRDNITMNAPDASDEDVINTARVACAHAFIMDLPKGYGSSVGERGAALSGGQRQRIAIARAILSRPKMLILDEATSALDYLTERTVCENLRRELAGDTVFFITHRLATIRSADSIMLMENGLLQEVGTHQQLLAVRVCIMPFIVNKMPPSTDSQLESPAPKALFFNASSGIAFRGLKYSLIPLVSLSRVYWGALVIWTIAAGSTAALIWAFRSC